MSKADKTFAKVMSGTSDANIRYADMVQMLLKIGFVARRGTGSHQVFQRGALMFNLQPENGMVKAYQVRQVREGLSRK